MRHLLTLMAATISVAACVPTPMPLALPVETGAPPRPQDPNVLILLLPASRDRIAKACTTATTLADETPVACAWMLNAQTCLIMLPEPGAVLPGDLDRIRAHELRHCTGQQHVEVTRPDNTRELRWLP